MHIIIAVAAAFGGAVSLVSAVIAIYDAVKNRPIPPQTRNLFISGIVISTVFLTLLFTIPALSSPPPESRGNGASTDTQISGNSQSGTGITPTSTLMPTPTPSPTPSPTPIPLPAIGTAFCQPKASDWPQTSDWQASGAEYVNTDGNSTPVIAPCSIPVKDYYVEAQIRLGNTSYVPSGAASVLARMNLQHQSGYKGGIFYGAACGENCGEAELDDLLNSQRITGQSSSFDSSTVSTVKLRVKGTDVTLYVNNNLVLEQHYTSANDAGQVGLECDLSCAVLKFTVVAQ